MRSTLFIGKGSWRPIAALLAIIALLAACSSPEDADVDPVDPVVHTITIEGGEDEITMLPDTTRALDYDVDADGDVSSDVEWASDDEDVAEIDEAGIVSAQLPGTATITATSVDDRSVEDEITVRVSSDGTWGVRIAQSDVTLEPGASRDLSYDVDVPEGVADEVRWTSSDEDVVTVDDGRLTAGAVEAGEATVTATLVADEDYSDTVTVSVSTEPTLEIDQDDLTLYRTQTVDLSVSVTPEGSVTWSSSNTDFVTIEGEDTTTPTITAVAPGTSTIVASNGDLEDSIDVTVLPIVVAIEPVDEPVVVGETHQMDVTVGAPENLAGVTWSVDDDSVATISETGLLTGVSPGSVEVTAVSEADPEAFDTVDVVIEAAEDGETDGTGDDGTGDDGETGGDETGDGEGDDGAGDDDETGDDEGDDGETGGDGAGDDGEEIEPSVDIEEGPISIEIDGTYSLDATVDVPEGTASDLSWSSSDETVVTVSGEGVVTGVAAGAATVTAALTADATVSDTVDVTVEEEAADTPPGVDLVVTSTADSDPYDLQDFTTAEPSIDGTLRWALEVAEDGDVIGFADGIDEIVVHGVDAMDIGTEADPDNVDAHLIFRSDVTLVGPPGGLTIRGESGYDPTTDPDDGANGFTYRSRMMYVPNDVDVTLENVTVTGGDFIFLGGGIRNDGTLTVRDSVVTGNRAWTYGGGVWNNGGDLTLEDTSIVDNGAYTTEEEVDDGGYEIRGGFPITMRDDGYAGGLYVSGGNVSIVGSSEITGNDAKYIGGGISMTGGSIVAEGTVISDNVADPTEMGAAGEGAGGGVAVFDDAMFDLSGGSITGNQALTYGGGLRLTSGGAAELVDVTFSDNTAETGDAIFHEYDSDPNDNLVIEGGNVAIGGEGYYPPDATGDAGLRSMRTSRDRLPDPFAHPEWRR